MQRPARTLRVLSASRHPPAPDKAALIECSLYPLWQGPSTINRTGKVEGDSKVWGP